jgi:predicted dehydrogenase
MGKVRIGFVGVGGMGQMAHLANYANLDECEVVALAEVRPGLAKKVARRYGIEKVYPDHKALLAAEQLDGVVASQPFTRHAVLLPDIYPAVKHVFTEKPLALSVEAGEGLVRAAAKAGCTHMVGYHKRSDPATVHARGMIERWKASGELGRMRYVRITMPPGDWVAAGFTGLLKTDEKAQGLEFEPPPRGMDEATAKQYGAFVNYYIHQVNLMRHLLGEPYRVAYAEKSGVLMAVESASGVAGVIEMAPYQTTRDWEESALAGFEKGYLILRLPAPLASNRAGTVEIFRDLGGGATPERTIPTMPWVHAMREQAANFVKVCRGEMAPPCDAAEALEDLKVARDYVLKRKALG